MSIKLDWEVESDGGWQEVGEDPDAVAARQRRLQLLRNVAVVVMILLALAGGGVAYRLNQVGNQLEADLEAVVAAETAALRIGDRRAFLKAQADVGEWVRLQDSTFAHYQALGSRLELTGEIIEMDLDVDKARVTILEYLDGEAYHVIWFYQRSEQGWMHIPPGADFWGEAVMDRAPNFNVEYFEEDAALAEALTVRLSGWYENACRMTACITRPGRITIEISPDPLATVGWASYDRSTLLIPSPKLGRYRANGQLDPILVNELARLIAVFWANQQFEDGIQSYTEQAWLRDDMALWLYGEFSGSDVSHTFFGDLYRVQNPSFIRSLLTNSVRADTVVELLGTLVSQPVTELDINWDSHLTYRLQAEAKKIEDGFPTEAELQFRDPERVQTTLLTDYPDQPQAVPESIEVIGTRYFNGVLWAEVTYDEVRELEDGTTKTITHRTYEPFRLVDNRWMHSYPVEADWGQPIELRDEHIMVTYYELDTPLVGNLLESVRSLYDEIDADYGVGDNPPTIEVIVFPADPEGDGGTSLALTPGSLVQEPGQPIRIAIPSPHLLVWAADVNATDHLQQAIAYQMVEQLTLYRVYPFEPAHPFTAAFIQWEMEQRGLDAAAGMEEYLSRAGRVSEQWPVGGGTLSFNPPYEDGDYRSAYVLIRAMVNRYGVEIVQKMIDVFPIAEDVEDWLTLTAGITFDDIREDWLTLYRRLYQEE